MIVENPVLRRLYSLEGEVVEHLSGLFHEVECRAQIYRKDPWRIETRIRLKDARGRPYEVVTNGSRELLEKKEFNHLPNYFRFLAENCFKLVYNQQVEARKK